MLISLEDPVTPVLSFPSWADQSIVLRCYKYEVIAGSVEAVDSRYDRLLPGISDLNWYNRTLRITVWSEDTYTVIRLCKAKPFEPLIQVTLTGYDPTHIPRPPDFDFDRQSVWRRLDQEPWVRPPTKPVSQNPVVQRTAGGIRKFLSRVLKLR